MSRLVILDSGPLGFVTTPSPGSEALSCSEWMMARVSAGDLFAAPEVADYEVRRELLRARKTAGLRRLDALCSHPGITYLTLSTPTMRLAAEYWARCRALGRPFAADRSLDADVILCAQASLAREAGSDVVVATTNPKHIDLFVDARHWRDVT